ncbi:Fc.00g058020.m01.CDS01 [Cosmosporella sp. VM-42]
MASEQKTQLDEPTASKDTPAAHNPSQALSGDPIDDEKHRKGYVLPYDTHHEYPLELGELVWIVKPEFRAPLGQFRITTAHEDDKFELIRCSDNQPYPQLVEGKYLKRTID